MTDQRQALYLIVADETEEFANALRYAAIEAQGVGAGVSRAAATNAGAATTAGAMASIPKSRVSRSWSRSLPIRITTC